MADEKFKISETFEKVFDTSRLSSSMFKTAFFRDNIDFTTRFDKDTFKGIVTKDTKTIVVDQDPDPGEFVPAGTPINVTLTVKEVIPVGSFKGIEAVIAGKYVNVGALEADLDKPDDQLAKDAKSVLDKKVEYGTLSTNDKQAVDNFMANRFGVDTEEKRAKVYNDIKFLHHL